MLKTFCVLLSSVLILASCAKISTVPVASTYSKESTTIAVAIIASGNHMTVGTTGEMGGGFGALGVLGELAGTSSARSALQEKLVAAVGDWRAEDVLRNAVIAELRRRNRKVVDTQNIVPLPASIVPAGKQGDNIGDLSHRWYNPDTTVFNHATLISQYKSDLILEAGYQGYELKESKQFGWLTGITLLLKVINPANGEVVGRSRTYLVPARNNRGIIGHYDLSDTSQIPPFVERFKNVFAQEVAKLSREGLDKLKL